MAGRKKHTMDLVRLGLEPELEGEIEELLEQGKSITRICEATGLCKSALTGWLEAPERAGMPSRARARAADHLASETIEIVDNVGEPVTDPVTGEKGLLVSSEHIQHAKLRTTTRQWLAERWNRDAYGPRVNALQINIGSLHLSALRQVEHARSGPAIADAVTHVQTVDN